jgi:catechol 2,3-dioxygenase-like lactoylglutathione lyase family enzyme
MRLDHVNIKAPGDLIEEVKDFYCQVLDLEPGFRPEFASRGYWLYAADKAIIHLSISDEMQGSGSGGFIDHVAFQTSGLNNAVEKLALLNISVRRNYIPELDMTQLFIQDPAGTGVEINFPGES